MRPSPEFRLAEAKSQAERRFLGRDHVIGVGISATPEQQLVFFLDHRSSSAEQTIADWARRFGINFEVKVVGGFKPLV